MTWYRFFRWFFGWIFVRPWFYVKVTGRENLPTKGPFIIAAGSHQASLDAVVLPVFLKEHQIHFLAKAELWKHRIMAWILNGIGQIPVVRQSPDGKGNSAVEAGVKVLKDGGIIALFPESTFSHDGKVHKGRTGAANMAIQADVLIIPVALVGMKRLNSSGFRFRPGRAEIRIGQPIDVKKFSPSGVFPSQSVAELDKARVVMLVIMHIIAELSDAVYEDTYLSSNGPK